jgi:hypothetical protein
VTRRGFFSRLSAFVATAVLDPERALWVPGRRLISIPAPASVISPDVLAREVLVIFRRDLKLVDLVNRQYDREFSIRVPRRIVPIGGAG